MSKLKDNQSYAEFIEELEGNNYADDNGNLDDSLEFRTPSAKEIEAANNFYKKLDERENKLSPEEKAYREELSARAFAQEKRNEEINKKRAEKAEKLSKMSEKEMLEYYKNMEKENDEFLKSLGISRAEISNGGKN